MSALQRCVPLLGWAALVLGCRAPAPVPPTGPGAGVTFTYPLDGQVDVPAGAKLVLHFTDPLSAAALQQACAVDGSGGVCMVGPDGLVSTQLTVTGATGNVLTITPSALEEGTSYRLFVSPSVLSTAVNLPIGTPLIHFTTRQQSPIAGVAPEVLTVNGEPLSAFQDGGSSLPWVGFAPLRLLFSEPIDPSTVSLGGSFAVVELDAGRETTVPGTLLAQGIHLTFDPDADFSGGASYKLKLDGSIADLNGERLSALELDLHPLDKTVGGGPFTNVMFVQPAGLAGLTGTPDNEVDTFASLIGDNILTLQRGSVPAELGAPSAFGGPIPFTIRKGNELTLSPLDIRLGGQVESGQQTGIIHFQFLTGATGFLLRNPYRSAATVPDDASAPVTVDLSFDAAMYSESATASAMVTQNLMAVRVIGTATASDGGLLIETAGAIEIDALGISRATGNMEMTLGTAEEAGPVSSPAPLQLIATYPGLPDAGLPVDGAPLLVFSRPVDVRALLQNGAVSLVDGQGGALPVTTTTLGAAVRLRPATELEYGASYQLKLNPARILDLAGQALALGPKDPTGGTGILPFTTPLLSAASPVAPTLLALYPGVPSALADGGCVGGQLSDTPYLPFVLPANRAIQAVFSEPIDPATLALGNACGQGAVRIEARDAKGACQEPVPGTLSVTERGFVFHPNAPWRSGASYALTLIGGPDKGCDAGEICSATPRLPLNTQPLRGVADAGGGPDLVIAFTGAPAISEGYVALSSWPYADVNGNGELDAQEVPQPTNQFGVVITGTTDLVSSAAFTAPLCQPAVAGVQACSAIHAELPVSVEAPLPTCPMDLNGQPTSSGPPCVPVRIYPEIFQSTGLSLTTVVGTSTVINATGAFLLRVRETGAGGSLGYVLRDANGQLQMVSLEQMYLDAPDLSILAGVVTHDLVSKPLDMLLRGPLGFSADGRMEATLSNVADLDLTIHLSLSGKVVGTISMRIPAGTLSLHVTGPPRS